MSWAHRAFPGCWQLWELMCKHRELQVMQDELLCVRGGGLWDAQAAAVLCPLHQSVLPFPDTARLLRVDAVPSMGLEELQYPLHMNARTGMNVWVHIFHMFQLNLPAAAHSGCRVSQRVHTSGSFPGEQWDGTLSTEGLCSHSVACEMLWMMENEELTLSWLRQQRTLPGAVYHSAAGVCFLQFFPSPCSFP